ncbi:hypothetical protein D6D08_05563 [Aureobasidium pullulans]|nr:hypothetical protein D6D08_05563 [Aureobasidium pullulans]
MYLLPPKLHPGLEARKDDIRHWIVDDGLKVLQVIAKLKHEHNVVCQKRTLERNLKTWGISKRSHLDKAALQQELTRLFRGPHQTDGDICKLLNEAGHVVNVRTVMETRKKLGLHKRIRPETNEEVLQNTIRQLLDEEYQDEAVVKMQRSELYTYLRHKYPEHDIIGRDRVYNIAREMNPHLKRRYPKGHPLYQNRPYKLSGKRLAAKLAADAAAAQPLDSPVPDEPHELPPIDDPDASPPPIYQDAMNDQASMTRSQPYNSIYTSPIHVPPPTTPHILDPILRVESLEKENGMLHDRLQQQDAEIQHMRQAYHDLMARLKSANPDNHYPT